MNVLEKIANLLDGGSPAVENAGKPPRSLAADPPPSKPSGTYRASIQSGSLSPEPQPVSPEAKAELSPKLRPAPSPDLLERIPIPTDATLSRIVRLTGFRLPDDVLGKSHELDKRWLAAQDGVLAHTYDQARAAFAEQQRILAENPAAVENVWSLEHLWLHNFSPKLKSFKAIQSRICSDHFALVHPYAEGMAKAIDDLADVLEERERPLYESLGIHYAPSLVVLTVRKAAHMVVQRSNECLTIRPAQSFAAFQSLTSGGNQ